MFSRPAFHIVFGLAVAFLSYKYYKNIHLAESHPPFKLLHLHGRGKGAIATRDIMQGEMIIKEEALFVIQRESFIKLGSHIKSTVSTLNSTDRVKFFELSHHLEPNHPGIPEAIFQTNSVKVGEDAAGVFPLTARLNHGCSKAFNAVHSIREDGSAVVHALKPIKKGEEILREYTDTRQPRKKRREKLHEIYAFDCSCNVCSLPSGESERSDTRLSSITTIQSQFERWKKDRSMDGREAVRLAKRVWTIQQVEGYWKGRGRLAEDVVEIAASHQDETAIRQWAELAVEWYSYEVGYDSREAARMRRYSSDPSKHPSWASREKLEMGSEYDFAMKKKREVPCVKLKPALI